MSFWDIQERCDLLTRRCEASFGSISRVLTPEP